MGTFRPVHQYRLKELELRTQFLTQRNFLIPKKKFYILHIERFGTEAVAL
jgi:hypothetical protein